MSDTYLRWLDELDGAVRQARSDHTDGNLDLVLLDLIRARNIIEHFIELLGFDEQGHE